MTSKQLFLAESPVGGYMMYSYHLAVTFSHIAAWPWFYTNYVQLQCDPEQLELTDLLDFSTMPKGEVHFTEGTSLYNPWLSDSEQIDEETFRSGHISAYVINKIDNNSYVETFVDEFYISSFFNGGVSHFGHRLLVFGYDESRCEFDIIGFDKNSQYRKLKCSFDELDLAFREASPQRQDRTKLWNLSKENEIVVDFDRERFLGVLNEYLSSSNSLLDPNLRGDLKSETTLWYGLKTYDFLKEYIVRSVERKAVNPRLGLDFRGFHMLWEHKKCMLNRLKWLKAAGYDIPDPLLDQYGRVVSLTELVRNRVIMCRRGFLPPGKGHLNEVPNQLEQARSVETELLSEVSRRLM